MRNDNVTHFHLLAHDLLQIVVAGCNACIRIGWHVMFNKKMFHAGNIRIVKDAFEVNDAFANRSWTLFLCSSRVSRRGLGVIEELSISC